MATVLFRSCVVRLNYWCPCCPDILPSTGFKVYSGWIIIYIFDCQCLHWKTMPLWLCINVYIPGFVCHERPNASKRSMDRLIRNRIEYLPYGYVMSERAMSFVNVTWYIFCFVLGDGPLTSMFVEWIAVSFKFNDVRSPNQGFDVSCCCLTHRWTPFRLLPRLKRFNKKEVILVDHVKNAYIVVEEVLLFEIHHLFVGLVFGDSSNKWRCVCSTSITCVCCMTQLIVDFFLKYSWLYHKSVAVRWCFI